MTEQAASIPRRSYTSIAAAIIVAAVVISAAIFTSSALYNTRTISTTDTFAQTITVLTASSTSCDYVLPYAVPCLIGQNFTVSVNYTGSWIVTYQGYNEDCYTYQIHAFTCNPDSQTLSGSYDGSGLNSRNITVTGQENGWTLCAQAQKPDASSSTLDLEVSDGPRNQTSLPFGTASTCSVELLL
jgi:hypothetical protein